MDTNRNQTQQVQPQGEATQDTQLQKEMKEIVIEAHNNSPEYIDDFRDTLKAFSG